MKWILSLEFEHFAIPKPDLNIFLDVLFHSLKGSFYPTGRAMTALILTAHRDIHEESLIFQKKVRDIYLKVANRTTAWLL